MNSGPVCEPPCKLVIPPEGGGVICVCPENVPVPAVSEPGLFVLGVLVLLAVFVVRKWYGN